MGHQSRIATKRERCAALIETEGGGAIRAIVLSRTAIPAMIGRNPEFGWFQAAIDAALRAGADCACCGRRIVPPIGAVALITGLTDHPTGAFIGLICAKDAVRDDVMKRLAKAGGWDWKKSFDPRLIHPHGGRG
jgi:hypothetical protein